MRLSGNLTNRDDVWLAVASCRLSGVSRSIHGSGPRLVRKRMRKAAAPSALLKVEFPSNY
jgi:hypothetical protein